MKRKKISRLVKSQYHYSKVKWMGFTLIELLIVIVIVTIISSVALLTFSHNKNKNAASFAHEWVRALTLAQHEAMLRPAVLGVGFTDTTYQFYIFHASQWEPLQDKIFKTHFIPQNIHIVLKINDQMIALDGKPVIVISEDGSFSPFILFLKAGKNNLYQVTGEENGNLLSGPSHDE